jgi:NADPH-dependent glutamate synthase beta subunit-like oxidoreductase
MQSIQQQQQQRRFISSIRTTWNRPMKNQPNRFVLNRRHQPCILQFNKTNHNNNYNKLQYHICCWRRLFSYQQHHYSSSSSFSSNYPITVAIIGSGPSGCYTAKYLLKSFQNIHNNRGSSGSNNVNTVSNIDDTSSRNEQYNFTIQQIDIIERLPTPYGLVRDGVAPDHPEVKNVQHDFDTLFESNNNNHNSHSETTKSKPIINFLGNVTVGIDVSIDELRALYDIVILCYGCGDSDRTLSIQQQLSSSSSSSSMNNINNNTSDIATATTNTKEQQQQLLLQNSCMLSAREFVAWYNGM